MVSSLPRNVMNAKYLNANNDLLGLTGSPKLSSTGNDWKSEVDKALMARLTYLEEQNDKQKETIKYLRQENAKYKSDQHQKVIAKHQLKLSGYGGPWSEAQLDLILNYHLRGCRKNKGRSVVKWSNEDIRNGILLFQRILLQGKLQPIVIRFLLMILMI